MPTKLDANASFKKPRLVFLVLALALIFSVVFVGGVSGAVFQGSGTEDDPYRIYTVDDLVNLAELVNSGESSYASAHYILSSDINCAGRSLEPIGHTNTFSGTFDGNWHSIISYYVVGVNKVCGLFGKVSGTISNLIVSDVTLNPGTGNTISGSIVGKIENGGKVKQCAVIGASPKPHDASGTMGGMIGYMPDYSNLEGWSVDDITEVNKGDFGIVVGNYPDIGSSGGYNEGYKRVSYTVKVYKLDNPYATSDPIPTEEIHYTVVKEGEVNNVRAVFIVDEGYFLDESKSVLDGQIINGETLELKVYLRKLMYLITIPASVYISEATNPETDPEAVMLMDVQYLWIPEGSSVSVTVNSQNDFHLKYSINPQINPLPYSLSVDSRILSNVNNVVKEFSHDDDDDVSLTITVEDEPHYSGVYTDLLTFTSRYVEPMQIT